MDRVKMDVSMGIWTYPRGKMDVQGIFKGGHFVRDAEVAGSNPVAPILLYPFICFLVEMYDDKAFIE